jgi:hypothetical protein
MRAFVLAALLAFPAMAQEAVPEFTQSEGAALRFLDKLTNVTGDVVLSRGQTAKFEKLIVRLDSCRYPTANPASDANAHLTVIDETTQSALFVGWMLASSPALSALDHPRYDVWVLSCVLPEVPAEEAPAEGE